VGFFRLGARHSVFVLILALGIPVTLAGAWVALHGGFGAGDLPAFLIWLLPLALAHLLATHLLMRRSWGSALSRAVLSAAVGAAIGLLWTLAMRWMMGPWFGLLSFPVWPILVLAGSLTLTLGARSPSR
jgi:hypothetical protein